MAELLIEAHGITKHYDGDTARVDVLSGVDFSMAPGELVGIYGTSGAGKSTLLHIFGGIDTPSAGSVKFMGNDIALMKDEERARMRNRHIGFIFQFYHLLSEFSALENVMIPCLIAGQSKAQARTQAERALEKVDLVPRAAHRRAELSGGEQQRVAIARAAVMKPQLICADEPTGNLDRHTGKKVWEHILGLNRETGIGMIVVSHNHELLDQMPKIYELKDGMLHGA